MGKSCVSYALRTDLSLRLSGLVNISHCNGDSSSWQKSIRKAHKNECRTTTVLIPLIDWEYFIN